MHNSWRQLGEKVSMSFKIGSEGIETSGSLKIPDFYMNMHVALVFKLEYSMSFGDKTRDLVLA